DWAAGGSHCPEASSSDSICTFMVPSFTMLADGTISQSITVALPKAFTVGLTGLTDGVILDAGGFVTLVFLVAATAQLAGGWLADRFPMKRSTSLPGRHRSRFSSSPRKPAMCRFSAR